MRCFVREINGNFHAAFDWAGVSYTHSLRTKNQQEAEVRLGPIRDMLTAWSRARCRCRPVPTSRLSSCRADN